MLDNLKHMGYTLLIVAGIFLLVFTIACILFFLIGFISDLCNDKGPQEILYKFGEWGAKLGRQIRGKKS